MIIIECIPESILNHGINQCTVIHSISETCLRNRVGSHGHIFHTACNNNISVSRQNHLSRLIYAVKTGTAYNVHGNRRNFNGKPCLDGSLTGHVLPLPCLDNASHVYLVYSLRRHACSV